MPPLMPDLDQIQWGVLILCAFLTGLTKSGIPGLGILTVTLMAATLPAMASTGVLLPMLIMADVFAVVAYRHAVEWSHLKRILPWTIGGVLAGFGLMHLARGWGDVQFRRFIGWVVLFMLGLDLWRRRRKEEDLGIPTQWWFAASLGILAGVTTMMANAAGAVVIIYLTAMRLPKKRFVGTRAWFFFLVNCFKVPFSSSLGLIDKETLTLNATLFPAILLGGILGIRVVQRIPQRRFSQLVLLLAWLSAIRLLLS